MSRQAAGRKGRTLDTGTGTMARDGAGGADGAVGSVMIAAGGTGGHLFPALALAEELGRRGRDVDLITDKRGGRFGDDFPARAVYRVAAATITSRAPAALMRTATALARGTAEARRILRKVRPAVVVGFGGYPTVPPIMAASLLHIPTLLHEQNAVMGRANRLLAARASAIALSFAETEHVTGPLAHNARLTGNPVREAVLAAAETPYEPPGAQGPIRLLIFGGSQGARYFSDTVPKALAMMPETLRRRLDVVQQCREEDVARVTEAYRHAGIRAEAASFFRDLPRRMAAAHLVIARAGASTVAELTVLGRPAILVPLPHALDNDQLHNATRLEKAGGAWCFAQAELTPERLCTEIGRRLRLPETLGRAAEAARRAGRPDAVARLADVVEALAGAGREAT